MSAAIEGEGICQNADKSLLGQSEVEYQDISPKTSFRLFFFKSQNKQFSNCKQRVDWEGGRPAKSGNQCDR